MHIILGATGHVGSAVARTLLHHREPVTVVTRSARRRAEWERLGAQVAVADVTDVAALRRVLRKGRRLFLLNPPAAPSTDTAAEERHTLGCILEALGDGAHLERIVAESTYGAQPGEGIGDLGVLYDMEQALARLPVPSRIIRAAYYMSNWDGALQTAREAGEVHTLYPTDFALPMAAPQDLGAHAARLLRDEEAPDGRGMLQYVEGPRRYSSSDVAEAFAAALGRPVKAVTTPRAQWTQALQQMGFSAPAAASMAKMTAITLDQRHEVASEPVKGPTMLQRYVDALVARQSAAAGSTA